MLAGSVGVRPDWATVSARRPTVGRNRCNGFHGTTGTATPAAIPRAASATRSRSSSGRW